MKVASDYRAEARDALRGRWGNAVLVTFVAVLLGGIASDFFEINFNVEERNVGYGGGMPYAFVAIFFGLLGILAIYGIAVFIIGGAIELGYRQYCIRFCQGETPGVGSLFTHMSYFGKALGLRIVMSIFIFLWTLLLIIPGIMAAYSYSMATYLMAENPEMGIMEAIGASKELMYGQRFALFCLDFSFIGWSILSALTFGIGALFLIPYQEMAHTSFYFTVTQNTGYSR